MRPIDFVRQGGLDEQLPPVSEPNYSQDAANVIIGATLRPQGVAMAGYKRRLDPIIEAWHADNPLVSRALLRRMAAHTAIGSVLAADEDAAKLDDLLVNQHFDLDASFSRKFPPTSGLSLIDFFVEKDIS